MLPRFGASAAAFFLQRIQVECREEEEALESGYLPGAEWPRAGQALLPPLAVVEGAGLPRALRGVEKPQPLSSESLKPLQVLTRNTSEEAVDRSAAWPLSPFVLLVLPYQKKLLFSGNPLESFALDFEGNFVIACRANKVQQMGDV